MPYGILMFFSVPSVMREEPTPAPSLNAPAKGREFWMLKTP